MMSQSIDQRQQQLRNAFEYHQQQIKLATERILEERGEDLERQVEMRELGPADAQIDPQFRQEAAEEMARELAQRGVRSGNFNLNDYRDVPDLGINRAESARNIREEEMAREHASEREAMPQDTELEPERRQAQTYADLKQEHADAISPDVARQAPAQEHEPIEFAEEREQESQPSRKYAELEQAHADAMSQDAGPDHERLEFAEDMDHERHMTQVKGDPDMEHAEGEDKGKVEQVKSIEEEVLGLVDPSQQFELDFDKMAEMGEGLEKNKDLAEKLEFFEHLHPSQGQDLEH